MSQSLMSYVEELSHVPEIPSFEPEIDDLDAEQDRKLRCATVQHRPVVVPSINLNKFLRQKCWEHTTKGPKCSVLFGCEMIQPGCMSLLRVPGRAFERPF